MIWWQVGLRGRTLSSDLPPGRTCKQEQLIRRLVPVICLWWLVAYIGLGAQSASFEPVSSSEVQNINNLVNPKPVISPAQEWQMRLETVASDQPQLKAQRDEQARQLLAQQQAVAAAQAAKAAPEMATAQAQQTVQLATGSHTDWMAQAGIASSDYGYVDYIVSHESGWNYLAVNSIGATGLCQSLPGNKMATAGADYLTNPITQLRWCNSYAMGRYGSWAGAYSAWVAQRWW